MGVVMSLGIYIGKKAACEYLSIPRSSFYRQISQKKPEVKQRCLPPLALSDEEQQRVLAVCHLERFWDSVPRQIYATLLDEGLYYCSISTMYRILRKHNEIKERRNQANRPYYEKPELLATGPNQVWSWDITKLKGPVKWTYFYLYVILDIFSRYVVGWMVAHRELAALAKRLIEDTCLKKNISPGELTVHADRGAA